MTQKTRTLTNMLAELTGGDRWRRRTRAAVAAGGMMPQTPAEGEWPAGAGATATAGRGFAARFGRARLRQRQA